MTRKTIILTTIVAVLAATATLVLVVLAINASPKPMRIAEPIDFSHTIDSDAFRQVQRVVLGSHAIPGNRIELFENGEEIYPAMLAAIEAAEKTVTFETYEYWGEEVGGDFAEALAAAAERGVRVHAIFDFIGSTQAGREKFERMEEAGVEVIRWREPSWYQMARFNHRTHRKLLIVDGNVGFTGGANIADAWKGSPETGGYRDNHYRIDGPAVAHLQGSFLENWLNATSRLLYTEDYFPELAPVGDLEIKVVNSSPREGTHRIRAMMLLAFAAAGDHIRIATPYFYPDNMVLDALLDARERGVEVTLMLAGEELDKGWVRQASMNRWGKLLEAGVKIHEYEPSMYHAKLYIVDDLWVSVGSANLDNRSFRINDETNIVVMDRDFATMMVDQFERDLEDSVAYDLDTWKDRPRLRRLKGWLTMTFGPHL